MTKTKKRIIALSIILSILILLIAFTVWGNSAAKINEIRIENEKIPDSFSGFRIAQISDLHSAEFGENNSKLLSLLKQCEPDIIVITGDLISRDDCELSVPVHFVKEAVKIAPVYYVTGNHEEPRQYWAEKLIEELYFAGVTVLEDESVRLERNGEYITLMGIRDNEYFSDSTYVGSTRSLVDKQIDGIKSGTDGYTVLLSHRPEFFDVYVENCIDLVFAGHAHGGQFRLPLIGGIIAPDQGLFPKYDSGEFTDGGTTMLVSRGLGNSSFPFRFNNRPEIVLAVLD